MKFDINLMVQKEKPQRIYIKIFLFTSLLFGLVFSFALVLTVYSLVLKAQERKLSERVFEAKGRIANNVDLKQKILVVSERVDAIRNIISKRSNLETGISQILTSIPDNLNIEVISAKEDVVTVRLESSDLSAFDNLFEAKLAALARDSSLKKIESTSFTRSGNYLLTLAFYFNPRESEESQ